MMLRIAFIAVTLIGLSGCVTDDLVQDTSRSAAKSVVTPIIADKFPGRNTAAYSDCVIDNATTDEIFDLAKAAVTGVDQSTVNTVIRISTRTGTVKCFLRVELG